MIVKFFVCYNFFILLKMQAEIQKQFILTSKIGNGNFSTVYLAKHIQTQEIVAVKTMKNHIPIAIKQAQLLKKITHPNVIKIYKFQKLKNKEEALIVLQYLPQNILQLYEAQEYGLKQDQVKCILFQSCMGLYHIHKKGIIHRDIKPENIMINRNKAEVKLIDFGLAIEQNICTTDYVATRWYRAPENLLGTKQYSVAIDIFSLGCVIVELIMGNPLFPGANNIDQIYKIIEMFGQPTATSWKNGYEMMILLGLNFQTKSPRKKTLRSLMASCSDGLIKLVQKMLILNPQKRITSQEILKDSYFNDIEKIIPPHVYDRFLIDINPKRLSMIQRDAGKIDRRGQKKERMRFLSEQKSFGAFSSFKSVQGTNILQKKYKKQAETKLNEIGKEMQKQKESQQKWSKKYTVSNQKYGVGKSSDNSLMKKSMIPNFDQEKVVISPDLTPRINNHDISSTLKKSISDYENNLIKLSLSLTNMKQRSLNELQEMQKPANSTDAKIQSQDNKIQTSTNSQMLSFRGFNQLKHKILTKETSASIFKKNLIKQDTQSNLPIKTNKVIEYLEKFQKSASKKKSITETFENIKYQPLLYRKNQNASLKKLAQNGEKKYFLRPSVQKSETIKGNAYKSPSKFHQLKISADKLKSHQNQHRNNFQNESNNINQTTSRRERNQTNRLSIEKQHLNANLRLQQNTSKQKCQKKPNNYTSNHFNQNKLNIYIPNHFNPYRQQNNKCYLALSPKELRTSHKKYYLSPSRNNQISFGEPKYRSDHKPSEFKMETNHSTTMNISTKRPIQNKIKLVSLRDNYPDSNPTPTYHNRKPLVTQSMDTANFITKNSFPYQRYDEFNNGNSNSGHPGRKEFNPIQNTNLVKNSSSLNSPRNFPYHQQKSSQIYSNNIGNLNSPTELGKNSSKQLKSQHNRYFFSKNSPKSPLQTTQSQIKAYSPASYSSIVQQFSKNDQKFNHHKINHTTLSQLRESITGLSQTLNEGSFLTQRVEKYNNKNIKINLNLNIYDNNKFLKRK